MQRLTSDEPAYVFARAVLGGGFISPEEVMAAYHGVVYGPEQAKELAAAIPPIGVLSLLRGYGYGLMPRPPQAVSLLDLRTANPDHFFSKGRGWYEKEKFARNDLTGAANWLAIKKVPSHDSTNTSEEQQDKLLTEAEYVPNAAEMSWFVTTFFEVRGVRLFEEVFVRTSSVVSDGSRVYVGLFAPLRGVDITGVWGAGRGAGLGLAPAHRLWPD